MNLCVERLLAAVTAAGDEMCPYSNEDKDLCEWLICFPPEAVAWFGWNPQLRPCFITSRRASSCQTVFLVYFKLNLCYKVVSF